MAAVSQPFYAPCRGGLKLGVNTFDLLNTPGVAIRLRNFEVALTGGYRRINGYTAFGGDYADSPIGSGALLGVFPYALGVVVVGGNGIYYTEDGSNYIQVNKDTSHSGMDEDDLENATILPRPNQQRARFALVKDEEDHTNSQYGVLYIATGDNRLAHFHIDGTGGGRLFFYEEVDGVGAPSGAGPISLFNDRLFVVDNINDPSTLYYSDVEDYDDFQGSGAGAVKVNSPIVGIKPFRDTLYIFCENSIHKLILTEDQIGFAVLPVTSNLGCLEEFSIQEISGDIVFLAPDGLRPISATERNNDIELGTISRDIQEIIDKVIKNKVAYTISSTVIRKKNQYRLFYYNGSVAKGVIGTLVNAEEGWQWTEISGLPVSCITSDYNSEGIEVVYHSDDTGLVYLHDTGNDFDGAPIEAEYLTAECMYGDLGMRKTLHYLALSVEREGPMDLSLYTTFDFDSRKILQPPPKDIHISETVGVYGEGIYGQSQYSAADDRFIRIPLQGSGSSIKIKFVSRDRNPPYTLQGYQLELFMSGRK